MSFKTKKRERFLVSPDGYFLELPDGSLSRVSPRACCPIVDHISVWPLSELAPRPDFGADVYFVGVPLRPCEGDQPFAVSLDQILCDPLDGRQKKQNITGAERAVLLRMLENGVINKKSVETILGRRDHSGETAGQILISNGLCHWEAMLAQCLDISPAARIDPPVLRALSERREWELLGEVLISLGKINRTDLEYALKLKREAMPALGQILTAMGACRNEDVKRCLKIQRQLQEGAGHESIALIGNLLVQQNVISQKDLKEALWKQQVSRQPLREILVQMGACNEQQLDECSLAQGTDFQQAVDEGALAQRLLKMRIITRSQLDDALRIQQRGRQVLGELLVNYNLCKAEDIEEVLSLQNDVRDAYRSGLERLGSLLIAKAKVPARFVEEALESQSIGRQPLGAVLVAVGACTAHDISNGLEIQKRWRALVKHGGDRLGEVLVHKRVITAEELQEPLLQHLREEKPLGRLLVESGICTPEAIIGVLLERDQQRQRKFAEFLESHACKLAPPPMDDRREKPIAIDGKTVLRKMAAISRARQSKDKGDK